MPTDKYLHSYSPAEAERLRQQSVMLSPFIYEHIDLSESQRVLEVGCGVGAHTELLLRKHPQLHITGIDIDTRQIAFAKAHLDTVLEIADRYRLLQADAADLSRLEGEPFDTVLITWVLEHAEQPAAILKELARILPSGCRLYISEVFNSSMYMLPRLPHFMRYYEQLMRYQLDQGGDGDIGIRVADMLLQAGFGEVSSRPYPIHLAGHKPELRRQMFHYWERLMISAWPALQSHGYVSKELWQHTEQELKTLAHDPDAIFFYCFVQSSAKVS